MGFEFALHVPKAPLDRHVESLTFYSGFDPQHDREKLIPDGAIQIIVDLTDTPKKLYAGETSDIAVDFRRSWISGMQQRWIVIEAQKMASMMVIQRLQVPRWCVRLRRLGVGEGRQRAQHPGNRGRGERRCRQAANPGRRS